MRGLEPALGEDRRVQAARQLAQLRGRPVELLGRLGQRLGAPPRPPAATWSAARRRSIATASSRCCAPSCRSRSTRRRSASAASTTRARDARSSSISATALGDVADVAGERVGPLRGQPGDRQLGGELGAVGAHAAHLDAAAEERSSPDVRAQAVAVRSRRSADDDVGQLRPAHGGGVDAEDLLGGGVEAGDAAGAVDGDDRVQRALEHAAHARLAGAQRAVGARPRDHLADLVADAGERVEQVLVGARSGGRRTPRRRRPGRRATAAGRRSSRPGPRRAPPARGRCRRRRSRSRSRRARRRRRGRPGPRPGAARSGRIACCPRVAAALLALPHEPRPQPARAARDPEHRARPAEHAAHDGHEVGERLAAAVDVGEDRAPPRSRGAAAAGSAARPLLGMPRRERYVLRQLALEDLARGVARQLVDEGDVARAPCSGRGARARTP